MPPPACRCLVDVALPAGVVCTGAAELPLADSERLQQLARRLRSFEEGKHTPSGEPRLLHELTVSRALPVDLLSAACLSWRMWPGHHGRSREGSATFSPGAIRQAKKLMSGECGLVPAQTSAGRERELFFVFSAQGNLVHTTALDIKQVRRSVQ